MTESPSSPSHPMKPWLYTLLFLPGILIPTVLFYQNTSALNLAVILPTVALALFVHAAWKHLDTGRGRPGAILAAGLFFIPILNLFWMYWAIYPLGKAVQADAKKYGVADEVGDSFSRVFCHIQIALLGFMIAASFASIILWGAQAGPSSGLTPPEVLVAIIFAFLLLLWLTVLHVMFFHYSRMINAIVGRRDEQHSPA